MNEEKYFIKKSLFKKKFKPKDFILKFVLTFSFFIVMSIVIMFFYFIFYNGIEYLNFDLIYNKVGKIQKGILPIIINTVYVVILTLLFSVPIAIGTAIYITQYAKSRKIIKIINFAINMLSSIPTILIGLFGYNIFCVFLGFAPSIFVGCLTMSFCVLPNIIETSKEAILSIPKSYKYGALSLGAEKHQIVFNIIIPNAMPGIITAIILAAGKIMGESAALLLTVGAASKMPSNLIQHIFSSGKTLTLHLYYTAGNSNSCNSFQICFAIASILIFLTLILNCLTKIFAKFLKKF